MDTSYTRMILNCKKHPKYEILGITNSFYTIRSNNLMINDHNTGALPKLLFVEVLLII